MGLVYIGNLFDTDVITPKIMKGKFQGGADQAITKGQMLEFTGAANTAWVPLDSDFDMTTVSEGGLAIAGQDIASGDLAGYYEIWVPRPGDVWQVDLAAASAIAFSTPLYYSSSTALTVTAGTNILAYSVGEDHYPDFQHRLSQGQLGDNGTTIKSVSKALVCFRNAVSHMARRQAA